MDKSTAESILKPSADKIKSKDDDHSSCLICPSCGSAWEPSVRWLKNSPIWPTTSLTIWATSSSIRRPFSSDSTIRVKPLLMKSLGRLPSTIFVRLWKLAPSSFGSLLNISTGVKFNDNLSHLICQLLEINWCWQYRIVILMTWSPSLLNKARLYYTSQND